MSSTHHLRNIVSARSPRAQRGTVAIMAVLLAALIVLFFIFLTAVPVQAQTFEVLYVFQNGQDGYSPGTLVFDKRDNLYGVSLGGHREGVCAPIGSCGRVFQLARRNADWFPFVLYDFIGGADGAYPTGLIMAPDGLLYGITQWGGHGAFCDSCGTVFRLKPSPGARSSQCCGWTETVIHTFGDRDHDGAIPEHPLVFDKAGNLYGTASDGGEFGYGVAYKLTPTNDGWTETILHRFGATGDGVNPLSGLTMDASGNLYGTTLYGGDLSSGTIYQLSPSENGWTEKVIYSFTGREDGWFLSAGPTLGPSGELYGATLNGGEGGGGVVFKLIPSGDRWNFTVLYSLTSTGLYAGPHADLALDSAGNLYGTTLPAGCSPVPRQSRNSEGCGTSEAYGTVFKLSPTKRGPWTYTLLHDFTGGYDGDTPWVGVILGPDGKLYGSARNGSQYYGLIYRITP